MLGGKTCTIQTLGSKTWTIHTAVGVNGLRPSKQASIGGLGGVSIRKSGLIEIAGSRREVLEKVGVKGNM